MNGKEYGDLTLEKNYNLSGKSSVQFKEMYVLKVQLCGDCLKKVHSIKGHALNKPLRSK